MKKKLLSLLLFVTLGGVHVMRSEEPEPITAEQTECVDPFDDDDFGGNVLDDIAAEVEGVEHARASDVNIGFNSETAYLAASVVWYLCVTYPYNSCVNYFNEWSKPELENEQSPNT